MNTTEYLDAIGLETETVVDKFFLDELKMVEPEATTLTGEDKERYYSYPIPKIMGDDTCSLPDQLEEQPYDLRKHFNDDKMIVFFNRIVELLQEQTAAEWVGIYKKIDNKLVKLAYRGTPSRPEFPLTEDFAKKSNNSKVGMTGKAIVVKNVQEWVEEGKAYYNCDSKVKSELCIPILIGGKIWGIFDLEAFDKSHFTERRICTVVETCLYLEKYLK